MRWVLLLSVVWMAACAARPQYFMPGEQVRGTRADGHREALYQLRGKTGRFGEARLWSRGSVVTMLDGAERTVLHVGFEINNTAGVPLELRPTDLKLEVVHTDAGTLGNIAPHSATTLVVPPQSLGQGQAIFLLPEGLEPEDLRAFRLHWVTHSGEQRYQNNTPFVERRVRSHHHHHAYAIYDVHHPHYWHYRRLGYCYDLACSRVIVVPTRIGPPGRSGRPAPGRRTRVRP